MIPSSNIAYTARRPTFSRCAISGTEIRLLSRSNGVSLGCMESVSGSDIWGYFLGSLRTENTRPRWQTVLPQLHDRHVFAFRRIATASGHYCLAFPANRSDESS